MTFNIKYRIILLLLRKFSGKIEYNEAHLINDTKTNNRTFRQIILSSDYENLKINLLENLDKKSVKLVEKILKRIENYVLKNKKLYLMSFFEVFKIKFANFCKKARIVECENGWECNGLKISRKHFNNEIFWDKYYIEEFSNLRKIKNKDIIDVGGFIGDSAVLFNKYTNKKVRVFEPCFSNYKDLLTTIEINKTNKIVPYCNGLGASEEEVYINIADKTGVGASIKDDSRIFSNPTKELIKIRRLDDIVKEENIDVGLIKVDVEGAEQDFLKGALETIKTQKPALLIAIYHTGEDFFEIKSLIDSLNLGYKFKIRKATKRTVLEDTVLICEVR